MASSGLKKIVLGHHGDADDPAIRERVEAQ